MGDDLTYAWHQYLWSISFDDVVATNNRSSVIMSMTSTLHGDVLWHTLHLDLNLWMSLQEVTWRSALSCMCANMTGGPDQTIQVLEYRSESAFRHHGVTTDEHPMLVQAAFIELLSSLGCYVHVHGGDVNLPMLVRSTSESVTRATHCIMLAQTMWDMVGKGSTFPSTSTALLERVCSSEMITGHRIMEMLAVYGNDLEGLLAMLTRVKEVRCSWGR